MKLLVITRYHSGFNLALGADSALLRPGEPVFLPETDNPAFSAVVPAIRICRLGFWVRSNFASYFDAVTLFHYLKPAEQDLPQWLPPYVADRTFSPGTWQPLPDDGIISAQVSRKPLPGHHGQTVAEQFRVSLQELDPEGLIRDLSRQITLKTGDILIFPDAGTRLRQAELDSGICADLNGAQVLDIRLK